MICTPEADKAKTEGAEPEEPKQAKTKSTEAAAWEPTKNTREAAETQTKAETGAGEEDATRTAQKSMVSINLSNHAAA